MRPRASSPSPEAKRLKILAFESSAKAAGVALLSDGALLAEYTQNSGQTHSRTLMQMAEDMLRNCDITAQNIDAVAVAAGPGSFTGVRIGVAAAKGFAWGRQLPLYGVSTLEAMALGAAVSDGVYCACMDARREQVYNALFCMKNGECSRLCADRALSISELAQELARLDGPVFLVGDGAKLCFDALHEGLSQLRLLPEHLRQQRAAGVALAAQRMKNAGGVGDAKTLAPSYLRLSQAERERNARMQNG